jgi:hypothetical protein
MLRYRAPYYGGLKPFSNAIVISAYYNNVQSGTSLWGTQAMPVWMLDAPAGILYGYVQYSNATI